MSTDTKLRRISIRAFVELHVDVQESNLPKTLSVMDELGYDIAALVNKTIREVAELQVGLRNMLLLSKLYVSSRELRKIPRLLAKFDIVSVCPEDRFVLNKIVRLPEVDIVTVDLSNPRALPSKSQLKVMAEEGKALEILLNKALGGQYRYMKTLDIIVHQLQNIDSLVVFFSQNIKSIYEVKNPRDIVAFIEVVTELERDYVEKLREHWLQFIVDSMYRRGIRNTTYYLMEP